MSGVNEIFNRYINTTMIDTSSFVLGLTHIGRYKTLKKTRVNKSAKVREYLNSKPNAGPTEVAQALKAYKISPGFVSNIKTKLKKQNGAVGIGRRGSKRNGSHAEIVVAAELIHVCGGVAAAHDALSAAGKVAEALRR